MLGAIHPSIGQEAVAAGICTNLRARRRAALDPSRPRPHHRQGRRAARDDVRAVRPRGRHLRRQGRLDAHRRLRRRHARRQRRGRGATSRSRPAPRMRSSCKGEDRIVCCFFGDGAINRGPFLEGAELGEDLRSAGAVRLRGQRLRRDHADRGADRPAPGRAARAAKPGHRRRPRSTATTSLAVDEAAARADRRRSAPVAGRSSLRADTYRIEGPHRGRPGALPQSAAEVASAGARDPIAALPRGCCRMPASTRRRSRATVRAAESEIARGLSRRAKRPPWPGPQLALADVQDIGDAGADRPMAELTYIEAGRRGARRGDAARPARLDARRGSRPRRRVRPVQGAARGVRRRRASSTRRSRRPASWAPRSAPR